MEPSLSQRFAQIPPSPTLALNTKAKAMARDGIKVINLSVGEPDCPTPSAIVDAGIDALRRGLTRYGASGGGPDLRRAIAHKLKRDQNLLFDSSEIVAGIGAKEILMHLIMAAFNDGDEVLIPAPYWVSYTSHCEIAGATPVIIPMTDDKAAGASPLDPKLIAKFVTPRTRGIIINSPNNPGGYVASAAQLSKLGAYLADKNWWIISDEIYEYLSFDSPHQSLLSLCPHLRDRFVLINGLSKGFAMTGWRVGYACGPTRLIRIVENLQSQSSTCIPGFIEAAAVVALDAGAPIFADGIASLKSRRDLVLTEVKKISGVDYLPPQGAFYLFLDLRKRLNGRSTLDFSQHLLQSGHTAMVPGEAFGAPGFVRMSYAVSPDNIRAGLQALDRCLSSF